MSRFGFDIDSLNDSFLNQLKEFKNYILGISSHIAFQGEDNSNILNQIDRFSKIQNKLQSAGLENIELTIASSESTLFSKESRMDINRIGLGCYGLFSSRQSSQDLSLIHI